jgi:ribA/ribD-fused uncharacterized protein
MSGIENNEITVPDYFRVNNREIFGFFGEYRWLSNFSPCNINYLGIDYWTVETAYQAQKLKNKDRFNCLSPSQAKQHICSLIKSKSEDLVPVTWFESQKIRLMQEILFLKFSGDFCLRENLLSTGNRKLVEANHWGDVFWGVDGRTKVGENHLGRILMATRAYFRQYNLHE